MAVVYRALDLTLEQAKLTLKVLRGLFRSDPAFRERFRQELQRRLTLPIPTS
jgi:hypothetical protein